MSSLEKVSVKTAANDFFFFFFFFDISKKVSFDMRCQYIFFSLKNKEKIECCQLETLSGALRINI